MFDGANQILVVERTAEETRHPCLPNTKTLVGVIKADTPLPSRSSIPLTLASCMVMMREEEEEEVATKI